VRDAVRELYNDEERHNKLMDGNNVFRVLAKTLITAGIITDRTAHVYASWVNMNELEAEDQEMPGAAAVIEGINDTRNPVRTHQVRLGPGPCGMYKKATN
jgi:hypothetical protein